MTYCQTVSYTLVELQKRSIIIDAGTITKLFTECPSLESDTALTIYNGQTAARTRPSTGGSNPTTEVTPPSPISTKPKDLSNDNPYFCGHPGARVPHTNNIGPALWDFDAAITIVWGSDSTAAKVQFTWVSDTNYVGTCTSNAGCTSPQVCGTVYKPLLPPGNIVTGKCGVQQGYWSANEICGVTGDGFPSNKFINCQTYKQLYRCDQGIKSCYADGATTACCGCVNWDSAPYNAAPYDIQVGEGKDSNGSPFTEQCKNTNPQFAADQVLKNLLWMKMACPSCYVYPFDDKASTFVCASDKTFATQNVVNYIIMACPSDITVSQAAYVTGHRVIKFYNNCDSKDVWPAVVGGAQRNVQSTDTNKSTLCNSDSDCYAGTKCIPTGSIKQCFWQNPDPVNGASYKLAKGDSIEFRIPIQNDQNGIVWSGVFGFRLGCPGSSVVGSADDLCDVGDCRKVGDTTFKCQASQGLQQPSTQAEFTMQKSAGDYYDVEIINGYSIDMKIMPSIS